MASTINVSALPNYVDQMSDDLLVKAMFGAKTLDYIELMPNVKKASALNYLDSTVVLADGTACGFNAQGSDVFTQREVTVAPLKVNKEWCERDLLPTWMNTQLLIEAGRETLPFEQKIVDANQKAIANELEKAIWQGNTVIDGFLDVIEDASADVIKATAGVTMAENVDAIYMALPGAVLEKNPVIFMSYTKFREYVAALNYNCCPNIPTIDGASRDLVYANDSRVTIVPVGGLEGTNAIVAGARDNFVYATDVEDAHATYKLWYSDDADVFRFKVLFNAGVQIKFPHETVILQIAD